MNLEIYLFSFWLGNCNDEEEEEVVDNWPWEFNNPNGIFDNLSNPFFVLGLNPIDNKIPWVWVDGKLLLLSRHSRIISVGIILVLNRIPIWSPPFQTISSSNNTWLALYSSW